MRNEQLRNFVAVIDCGSINKAAEKLYISQPNLSRSIRALEEEMGKPLLIRNNRGVTLTGTGKIIYYYARSILSQYDVIEQLKTIKEEKVYSQLSVSIASIFLQDDIILKYYDQVQSAQTHTHLYETTTEDVITNVSSGKSEFGITILNENQLTVLKKMADLRELEIQVLDHGPMYIHVSSDHPLAQKEEIEMKDLLDYTRMLLPYDFFSNLNNSLAVDDIPLSQFTKTITMSNYHNMLNMLIHTNAFLFGNKWQVKELTKKNITSRILKRAPMEEYFVILKRSREEFSQSASLFLDIVKLAYHFE